MPTNEEIRSRYEGKQGENYKQRARQNIFSPEILENIINSIPPDGSFLDVGCGVGVFLEQLIKTAERMGRQDIEFFAFDYAQGMAEESQKRNPKAKVFHDSLINLTSEVGQRRFDYVFSLDVLFFFNPELGERDEAFANLARLTKKDGTLHVSIREKRFDKDEEGKIFFDFSEHDLRTCMQKHGFQIDSSKIGHKKNYGPAKQDNLDRFYDALIIKGHNIKKTPEPTLADQHSQVRAGALCNKQKAKSSSIKLG